MHWPRPHGIWGLRSPNKQSHHLSLLNGVRRINVVSAQDSRRAWPICPAMPLSVVRRWPITDPPAQPSKVKKEQASSQSSWSEHRRRHHRSVRKTTKRLLIPLPKLRRFGLWPKKLAEKGLDAILVNTVGDGRRLYR